jgi:hypothetical protein
MKDEEIARLRLRRQHLIGTPLPTPEAVVGWLGVVQAQEFGVAKDADRPARARPNGLVLLAKRAEPKPCSRGARRCCVKHSAVVGSTPSIILAAIASKTGCHSVSALSHQLSLHH